jgi:hypothetical protein
MEWTISPLGLAATSLLLAAIAAGADAQDPRDWAIHDEKRPQPRIVDPGAAPTGDSPGRAPADAIVLFDGKDLSQWRSQKEGGGPAPWKVESGYMEVVAGSGGIQTAAGFGDCQLHLEWASPASATGEGQNRGNSGVFLMGQYEVQILDSHGNTTYPDGQAAAIYGQYPPLVNPTRPPGEWQVYDIVFFGPRFDAAGKLLRPGRFTVFLNGVLTQHNVELVGPTSHKVRDPYTAHPEKGPVSLQDHDHPVRFRNIWLRPVVEAAD